MQIYQEMSWSDYPILGAEIARARKGFSADNSAHKYDTQSAQTTIPPNHHKAL